MVSPVLQPSAHAELNESIYLQLNKAHSYAFIGTQISMVLVTAGAVSETAQCLSQCVPSLEVYQENQI